MPHLTLSKELSGSILDIGGGGEGVIGRLYGAQVTAIDNRQEELDEAPAGCTKLLMDAAALTFADASFDHVTFFFSLLYMDRETQRQALAQAARVLRGGGTLTVWDAVVETAWPDPFVVELTLDVAGTRLTPTYGVVKPDAAQSAERIAALCMACGLTLCRSSGTPETFQLVFQKPAE